MTNIVKKCAAILIGLALTATGLWAGGGADTEPAAAAEKEMVMDPTTAQDGERTRVWRDYHRAVQSGP